MYQLFRRIVLVLTSILPALQCTGVAIISDVSPLKVGSASSRSQQVFHSAVVSQGTSGFSGRS